MFIKLVGIQSRAFIASLCIPIYAITHVYRVQQDLLTNAYIFVLFDVIDFFLSLNNRDISVWQFRENNGFFYYLCEFVLFFSDLKIQTLRRKFPKNIFSFTILCCKQWLFFIKLRINKNKNKTV